MNFIGKLLGLFIGYKAGGFFGAVIGMFLGHLADKNSTNLAASIPAFLKAKLPVNPCLCRRPLRYWAI